MHIVSMLRQTAAIVAAYGTCADNGDTTERGGNGRSWSHGIGGLTSANIPETLDIFQERVVKPLAALHKGNISGLHRILHGAYRS